MTALSVGYIQTYRDSVDSLGESVDMSIKVKCVCGFVCVFVCVPLTDSNKFIFILWVLLVVILGNIGHHIKLKKHIKWAH